MKISAWATAAALAGCLLGSDAFAQELRQPLSIKPAAFDYHRYLQEEAASPSDAAKQEEAAGTGVQEPAPIAESAPAPVAGCTGGCDTGCDSGCDTSCGGCDSCGFSALGGIDLLGDCCLGEPFSLSDQLFCEGSAWSVGGWSQIGYHDENNGLFNNHRGKLNLHQQWLYLEKAAQPNGGWDWGFRADLVYGVDAPDTQAFGNTVDGAGNPRGYDTGWDHGIYGWAMPQLYGEIASENLSIRMGHFYTKHGYEVVPAPDNFFYSHAFTFFNSEPFTHTGVLATYKVSDNIEAFGGWVLGWDTAFDQFDDGNMYLGGATVSLNDDVTVYTTSAIGDFGWRGSDGYLQSLVIEMQLTEKLEWVVASDVLRVDSTGEDNVGINQYLFYTVNDCLKLGTRIEWWRTDPLVRGFGNVSVYEATWGLNYKPHANLVVRPEIRQEWSPGVDFDQTIFGFDVIATF